MGLSFDMLTFDCYLKPPQPVTGLFLTDSGNFNLEDRFAIKLDNFSSLSNSYTRTIFCAIV